LNFSSTKDSNTINQYNEIRKRRILKNLLRHDDTCCASSFCAFVGLVHRLFWREEGGGKGREGGRE
jgi:hypothetical protein